jgi:hypothetical protein
MRNLAPLLAASTALCLTACVSVPSMDLATGAEGEAPPASVRIVNQIACEISEAPGFSELKSRGYAISAVVPMKVKDKTAATPSVSFIDLFGRSGNSYTSTVGGELGRARTRIFTQTFTLDAAAIGCDNRIPRRFQGSLGLGEVIATGLYELPGGMTFVALDAGASSEAAPPPAQPYRSFASTIEFEVTRSATGGPQWVRPLFKEPGAGSGLFGLSRVDTDTLAISFGAPKPKTAGAAAAESAQRQSLDLLNTMILQNLDVTH